MSRKKQEAYDIFVDETTVLTDVQWDILLARFKEESSPLTVVGQACRCRFPVHHDHCPVHGVGVILKLDLQ